VEKLDYKKYVDYKHVRTESKYLLMEILDN